MNQWPQLSRPLDQPQLRVLSHGGGVQTSVLCLMAAHGEVGPMPDLAIFADTGGELRRTYDYLDWLQEKVPFPIVTVRRPGSSLATASFRSPTGSASAKARRWSRSMPWPKTAPARWARSNAARPAQEKGGFHFSKDYKTRPVAREIAAMLGFEKRGPAEPCVELWIGMTMDEIWRAATNERKWIHNRHPLIELGMSRRDCERWAEKRGYPLPRKSSCIFCPFRDNEAWRDMSANDPEDFEHACQFDEAIRPGWEGIDGQLYVHRSFKPLREAVLTERTPELLHAIRSGPQHAASPRSTATSANPRSEVRSEVGRFR
jgi:hypothetical protein